MKNSKVSLQEKTKALANEALNCLQSCDKVSRQQWEQMIKKHTKGCEGDDRHEMMIDTRLFFHGKVAFDMNGNLCKIK